MDYQTLIDQKKYAEAVIELRKETEISPDDKKRSLLAKCLAIVGNVEEALLVASQIEKPTSQDHILLAKIQWQLEKWDGMELALKSAIRESPSPEVFHLLAIAEQRGRYPSQLDAATKEIMRGYLSKAANFEDCPVDSFLFLSQLYGAEQSEDKLSILWNALERFPNNPGVRLELAAVLIYDKEQYKRAIEIVTPLLEKGERAEEAKRYVFEALILQREYSDANQLLETMFFEKPGVQERISADLLFLQGKLGEWLVRSEECANDDGIEVDPRKHFRKAYVNLRHNNPREAIDDFTRGANLILEKEATPDIPVFVNIGGSMFIYTEFDVLGNVCETLLLMRDETELINDEILGLLAYTVYRCCSQKQQEELLPFFPDHSGTLLLLAAKQLNFPLPLGEQVAWELLDDDPIDALHHYFSYAVWSQDSSVDFFREFSDRVKVGQEQVGKDDLENISRVAQTLLDRLVTTKHIQGITNVFLPFYDEFWRQALFDAKLFTVVADTCSKLVDTTHGSIGLFDYAYALEALRRTEEAKSAYQQLVKQDPKNTAALNNLGVIYEHDNFLDEALVLFSRAADLEPEEKLYSQNCEKLGRKIEFRNQSRQNAQKSIDSINRKAREIGISDEQFAVLNELYWQAGASSKEIEARLGLPSSTKKLNNLVLPQPANEKCPNCLNELVYKTRSAKNMDEKICLGCGHQSKGWCRCSYCKRREEEKARRAEQTRRLAAIEEFGKQQAQYCKADYVEWAIAKLTRKEKLFLKSFIEVVQNDKPEWAQIRERAGVVSEKGYVEKLKSLKLLLVDPSKGVLLYNTAMQLSMLEMENVRRISPSLRFDVFQRDNHTCQYCGRTPPDIKLVIDHLFPVAQGGTDDFENLVTSCEECNSGKSAKLIQDFTGGHGKEEWSEQIRFKRASILSARRERLDEIRQSWKESLDLRALSERDDTAIYRFIERYEPDWIKAAIQIAARKKIQNYIAYAGGILRRWGKEGPPEHLANPDAGLAKKPATPKQITYIASLLERAVLALADVCDRTDFDQLTMLDARNLISTLTEKIEE